MTVIYHIKFDGQYYSAVDEKGEVQLGGPHDAGMADGTDLQEIMRVSIEDADVIYCFPIPTKTELK